MLALCSQQIGKKLTTLTMHATSPSTNHLNYMKSNQSADTAWVTSTALTYLPEKHLHGSETCLTLTRLTARFTEEYLKLKHKISDDVID